MDRKKRNIIGRISAFTTSILLAAQCFTAFAEASPIPGDVNSDGKVDVSDVVAVAAHVKSVKMLDKDKTAIADVNSDGVINVSDVAILAAHIKGIKPMPKMPKTQFKKIEALNKASLGYVSNSKIVSVVSPVGNVYAEDAEYTVLIYDVETGETESRSIVSSTYLNFVGIKKDGTLILSKDRSPNGTDICFYAPGKDEPEIVNIDMSFPAFGYDEETDEIYIFADIIYRMTPDGKLEDISASAGINKNDWMHHDLKNKMVGVVHKNSSNKDLSQLNIFSLSKGAKLWETVQHDGSTYFTKNNTIVTDRISDSETSLRCFDTNTGELQGIYKFEGSEPFIDTSSRSDKCLFIEHSQQLVIFDSAAGSIAHVDTGIKNLRINHIDFLDEDTLVLNITIPGEKTFEDETYIVDLSDAGFSKLPEGRNVAEMEEYKPKALGEALKEQRKKADELEEKYGVTIFIGNEVLNVDSFDEGWSSVEEMSEDDYVPSTNNTLSNLEDWLDSYPEGFFEKFKTERFPEGYRIILISDFNSNATATNELAGMTYCGNNSIDIAVINYVWDLASTMDHETWHAVEDLVESEYPFNDSEWAKLNPEGIDYYYGDYFHGNNPDQDVYGPYMTHYNDEDINYDNGYFVRDYSVTAPQEDRATIIEFLYPSDKNGNVYDPELDISKFPHLKAKLDYMGKWIEPFFGYIYWEEMTKDRYVPGDEGAKG